MEIKHYQDIYIFDDGKVREFLIIGQKKAVLIDTGFKDTHVIDLVKSMTSLPVQLIITHGNRDHIGDLEDFEECFIHQKDETLITCDIQKHYLKDGDMININDYHFKVIEILGHTYGSIALFDESRGLLIGGNSVQVGPIYMFGEHRNLDLYITSMEKLMKIQDKIQVILPSHHLYPITREYIEYCLNDAIKLKNGQLQGSTVNEMPCNCFKGEHVQFLF
ncbi:MAG: MBL fold metallo-hydrolase [Erysipelotrichaceae bacterium]|nr:MBL fold metallo-hydrolase [Erysipelotrichaceae bacterium]